MRTGARACMCALTVARVCRRETEMLVRRPSFYKRLLQQCDDAAVHNTNCFFISKLHYKYTRRLFNK